MIQGCLAAGLLLPAVADRLELQGDAAIIGRVLAEKPDHLVIDVGYTVLLVPRAQIVGVSMDDAAAGTPDSEPSQAPPEVSTAVPGFFRTGGDRSRTRTVRELVTLLGEGVVQVRTPGGLGSGFLINEEGFLITNFHVIEGETEISVEVYWQTNGQLERKTYKQVRIIAMK